MFQTCRKNTVSLIVGIALCFVLVSCSEPPLRIGYSGPLKGKFSDIGVQGRNGATLAVEEINQAGGVSCRMLELVAKDDQSTAEGAVQADKELIEMGIPVIIGHMTSAQSMAALEAFSPEDVLYISPTTSTSLLQGKKDNFFRVIYTLTSLTKALAKYAVTTLNVNKIALVWDPSNAQFSKTYKDSFIEYLKAHNGTVVGQIAIHTNQDQVDWNSIISQLNHMQPDAVVLVTSARDLAKFAQYSRLNKSRWQILSSMWGYTKELIQTGGKSVEGIFFAAHFSEYSAESGYLTFKKRYMERFGWEPNFAAVYAYDAVRVFAKAVEKNNGTVKGIDTILPGMHFPDGISGAFTIDEYGDVRREGDIVTVTNGKFITVHRGKE